MIVDVASLALDALSLVGGFASSSGLGTVILSSLFKGVIGVIVVAVTFIGGILSLIEKIKTATEAKATLKNAKEVFLDKEPLVDEKTRLETMRLTIEIWQQELIRTSESIARVDAKLDTLMVKTTSRPAETAPGDDWDPEPNGPGGAAMPRPVRKPATKASRPPLYVIKGGKPDNGNDIVDTINGLLAWLHSVGGALGTARHDRVCVPTQSGTAQDARMIMMAGESGTQRRGGNIYGYTSAVLKPTNVLLDKVNAFTDRVGISIVRAIAAIADNIQTRHAVGAAGPAHSDFVYA